MEKTLEKELAKVSNLENLKRDYETKLQEKDDQQQQLLQRITELESTKQALAEDQQRAIDDLKLQYTTLNKDLEHDDEFSRKRIDDLNTELTSLQDRIIQIQEQIGREVEANSTLKTNISEASTGFADVESELHSLKSKVEQTDGTLLERQKKIEACDDQIVAMKWEVRQMEEQLREEEKMRRKLHNTIQELKGNIRVFCRIRPILEHEKQRGVNMASIHISGEDGENIELLEETYSSLGKLSKKTYSFSFDKVFAPESTQEDCYLEISQLIQSALDGYNVCIFAYGQTGSGKTYTMEGVPDGNSQPSGMIPRAVEQIYTMAQKLQEYNWEYNMEGQFMEIYNETIHDLLGDPTEYGKIKHEVRHDPDGKTIITDITTVPLDSMAKVSYMLARAKRNRATGATNMNERSSRSHSVFILKIFGHNVTTGEHSEGTLNLIDLAGSERLSVSGATGERLKETQAINKSLSCLGDVIHALINKKEGSHIPYRNSKLTYLLQNSLGGNSKTLMFVNLSPLSEHFGETLCSLRFATKVNSCKIGHLKRTIY
ncbi:kinesin [Radiomyces spectabilis]|uniref:kinesin n=1 Tax=Radiomyces spectabilis TaxID=64574 RepID=UPI00221E3A31|nr:kinesin [Radiomyces spectabilis]KAI8373234.1 kinesin [Radiomyces spectabilis]